MADFFNQNSLDGDAEENSRDEELDYGGGIGDENDDKSNDDTEVDAEVIENEPEENDEKPEVRLAAAKTSKDNDEGTLTVDVYQSGEDLVVKSTIAGVTADDLDITINSDMVTIKGGRQPDEKIKDSDYHWQELYWGSFSRTVILPEEIDVDKAKASIKNGILTIKMPRLSAKKTRKVKASQ